jgi:hypothetical protein
VPRATGRPFRVGCGRVVHARRVSSLARLAEMPATRDSSSDPAPPAAPQDDGTLRRLVSGGNARPFRDLRARLPKGTRRCQRSS